MHYSTLGVWTCQYFLNIDFRYRRLLSAGGPCSSRSIRSNHESAKNKN
jgi:hypothetical protein